MYNTLRTDVHPASGCHLPVVCDTHFFRNLPVFHIVKHTDHQRICDRNSRGLRPGLEKSQRMSALHNKCGVFCQFFQVLFDQPVLHPVLTYTSGLSISNQFVGIQSYFKIQIVIDHDLKRFSLDTFSLVFVNRLSIDTSCRTETISINTSFCIQFIQEFRYQLFMVLRFYITKCIFQGCFCLFLCQMKSSGRRTPDPRLKFRHFR